MSPEEVGLTRIIQDAAMLMVPFAQLGVGQLTIRYYPNYDGKPQYGAFVSIIMAMLLIALLFFVALFLIFLGPLSNYFSHQSPEVINYLFYILGLTLILSVYHVLVSFSQSSLNIILPSFLKEIVLRILTLLGLILFATQLISFNQFINLLMLAYGFNLILLLTYLFWRGALKFQFNRIPFDRPIISEMVAYSLFTFLGASGILIIGKIDSVMVTGMLGLTDNAIYTTAFYIAVLIEIPKRAIAQISMPMISRAFKNNNLKEIEAIYSKSAINNSIIGILIFIGLWINLDNIFLLIPRSEVYSLGSMVVLIIGAGKLIDMSAGLNGEIIIMSKYYKVNVQLILFLTVVTVLANYILIPIYGLNGAAIGSTLTFLIFNAIKFAFLYAKYKIQPFSLNTLKLLIIGLVVLIIGLSLPQLSNNYIDIFYRSTIVTVMYSSVVYLFEISPDLNNQINILTRRYRR